MAPETLLEKVLTEKRDELLDSWIEHQGRSSEVRDDPLSAEEIRQQSRRVLDLFAGAVASGELKAIGGDAWSDLRASLEELSRSRERQGFTPTETIGFILSLRHPLFEAIGRLGPEDPAALSANLATVAFLLEQLGLFVNEIFIESREDTIRRQQDELMELSTPVIKLWEGILAVPLIGTLDSARTQMVTEELLERIVETGAATAIIDITGVPAVDTLVAQHLFKTIAAARLMGTECIVSGVRPQIAQTMVDLGIEFEQIRTKQTLGDAMAMAFKDAGWVVSRGAGRGRE